MFNRVFNSAPVQQEESESSGLKVAGESETVVSSKLAHENDFETSNKVVSKSKKNKGLADKKKDSLFDGNLFDQIRSSIFKNNDLLTDDDE
eukprot:TRINITY_DN17357_c0_g1_i1.p1 TRINITY_DN17357_c0_g1~~TRINITY_DN17357_c0_g1_i1.p1  ORF type:complete len:91 (-),score=16.79 TRINITY_DN17357_c0_g1_i1:103-375(-)